MKIKNKFLQSTIKNIWWISFILVFAIGFTIILFYCYCKNNYTLSNITLPDWLNYFAACGTIGGFLYLILDKTLTEKEANHLKWQSQIPFVTLSSPCDPMGTYCDIDIMRSTNKDDYSEKGFAYFSICNLGKTNAYDIKILFSSNDNFIDSNIFNRHYIPYLPPLQPVIDSGMYGISYANFQYIYSKHNINPDTKEISNTSFEICNCLSNCQISTSNKEEKIFYVKIIYYSSFSKEHRYEMTSTLKVIVVCKQQTEHPAIYIKGITFIDYKYEEQ